MTTSLISWIYVLIIVTVIVLHRRKVNALKTKHKHRLVTINMALNEHKLQIKKRHHYLNNYDFRRYNLDEALVIQNNIIL